jgi:hypothetical protein
MAEHVSRICGQSRDIQMAKERLIHASGVRWEPIHGGIYFKLNLRAMISFADGQDFCTEI